MAKTQITPLTYATDDNALLLLCADPAACARGTTDFVFDWRDPVQWGGALPVAGAPLPLRDFQNLALDKSAILVRDQQIMAPYVYGTQAHISDGNRFIVELGFEAPPGDPDARKGSSEEP